jgi:transcriptional regulator with XRE-family HTH domain
MATLDEESEKFARLGAALRARRRDRRRTLVEVATEAGLSHSFLSQIERGLARPSVESLHRLGMALGTTSAALLAEPSVDGVTVLRKGEGLQIMHNQAVGPALGFSRHLLFGSPTSEVLEKVGGSPEMGVYWEHPGQEVLYVIEGTLEVELDERSSILEPGESVCFPGETPHRMRGMTPSTRYLLVCIDSHIGVVGDAHGNGAEPRHR